MSPSFSPYAPPPLIMGPAEWGLLLLLSVLWGGTFFFVEVALVELPPLTLVLGRVTLAAGALILAARVSGLALPRKAATWRAFAVMAVFNNVVPFSLIFWGQTRIDGGLASILNATTPLFTVVVAHFATHDERLTLARLAGVALGVAGVAVLTGPSALAGLDDDLLAQLACLGAALSYACTGVYGRRFAGQPPLITAAGQLTCAAVILAPIALALDRPWTLAVVRPATWAALLGLSLLSTALAYIWYFRILARAGAINLLLVTLLIPVSAIALGSAFLGEEFGVRHLAGLILIALGLGAIDGRPVKWIAALRVR